MKYVIAPYGLGFKVKRTWLWGLVAEDVTDFRWDGWMGHYEVMFFQSETAAEQFIDEALASQQAHARHSQIPPRVYPPPFDKPT